MVAIADNVFLYGCFCKYLLYRHLLEKHNVENLQNFAKAVRESEFFLDNGHQHVDADRNPDLGLDGIVAGAEKGFDAQILFDPFEEEFDVPATLIYTGNGPCRQGEIVG